MVEGKRILVVDDSRTVRQIIRAELEADGYQVYEAADGLLALEFIQSNFIPDLITMDLEMPKLDGLSTYKRLLAREFRAGFDGDQLEDLPVIFISGTDTIAIRREGFSLGATDFITKPFKSGYLRAAVEKALHCDSHLRGLTVLVVDDSRINRMIVRKILGQEGISILEAADGLAGYEMVCNRMDEIDLVVTDLFMPEMNGDELCRRIRMELNLESLPIIFLTGLSEQAELLKLFKVGASDYLTKPFAKEELLARLSVHLERRLLAVRLNRGVGEYRLLSIMKDKLLALNPRDLRGPLADMQGELRDLGRLQSDDPVLELEEISVEELAGLSCNALRQLAHKRGQEIELICETGRDLILVHKNEMFKAVNNLLSNAIKFSPDGARIRVQVATGGHNQLQLSVHDSGPGIADDEIPHLFDSYSGETEKERWHGLATVKEVVNQFGGRVEANSVVGHGTTFTIHLPLAPRSRGELAATDDSGPGSEDRLDESGNRISLNVLLAEDNAISIRFSVELLRRAGHRVTVAEDGVEAINFAESGDFDLILMDLSMPRLGGVVATRRIRMRGDLKTPIIALTANSGQALLMKCEAVGMNGFLTKPLCMEELNELLAKWFVPDPV